MDIIVENEGLNGVSNYEPLKAWALETADRVKSIVVTDESIRSAKQDIADLRNLAKKISDYRIALKKEHEKKIEVTINQCVELTKILTDAASAMDVQVKELEDGVKQQKKQELENFYNETAGDIAIVLPFENVFNAKWLNKSERIESIKNEIKDCVETVKKNLDILHGMESEYETEMIESYLETLDMGAALATKNRLEEKALQLAKMQLKEAKAESDKAMQEFRESRKQEQNPVQPVVEEVKFYDCRLYMTDTQKRMFKEFVTANGIRYTRVPKE